MKIAFIPAFTSHKRLEEFYDWSERDDIGKWEPRSFHADVIFLLAQRFGVRNIKKNLKM